MARGQLVYIVGPSGAGKDAVIAHTRAMLACRDGIAFAHRYITRPVAAGDENHIALSPGEFRQRARGGCFALRWRSHHLEYGIGIEIDHWLATGFTVIVNGSRAYLATARQRYPDLQAVIITTSPALIEQRLRMRARDTGDEIAERLARNAALNHRIADAFVIDNSGALPIVARALGAFILGGRRRQQ